MSDDYYERGHLDYVFKTFDNGIIGDRVSKGQGIVLDIGANIGNHTLFFCNEYKAKAVYCFEPVEETFSILVENMRLNHLEERVHLNKFGLGEREERRSVVRYDRGNIGHTVLRTDKNGQLEIRRLDDSGIGEEVVLIKIDVEGMEANVLKGGLQLIQKNMPYIMIESFDYKFLEVEKILCDMGYVCDRLGLGDWLFYPGEVCA